MRDDVNMYAIRLTVPEGVTQLDVKDDFLATAAANGFSAGASTSANLALLSWNELVLYPAGHRDDADIYVQPSVSVCRRDGSTERRCHAQRRGKNPIRSRQHDGAVHFDTVSLEQLIDSPLLSGRSILCKSTLRRK